MTASEVARLLSERTEEVCELLLPNGIRKGTEWLVGSVHGEHGQSCRVHLTGAKSGQWCDFAKPEDRGDLINLWAATKGLSLSDALHEAKRWLGFDDIKFMGPKTSQQKYSKPKKPECKAPAENTPVMKYLTEERKITAEVIAAYKIGEDPQNIIFPYLYENQLKLVKFLGLQRDERGKKKCFVESGCEPCLFGWQVVGDKDREIIITEGEIDAMTWLVYGFPALSVPFGGGAGDKQKWIENEFDNLQRFDTIYLCFDMDEEGQAAAKLIADRLGHHRCRFVEKPQKDINECLLNGITAGTAVQYLYEARSIDPEELRSAKEFTQEVIEEFWPEGGEEPGMKIRWREKGQESLVFAKAEVSIWTGINGHGKSQALGHISIIGMADEQEKFCVASMELKPRRLLKRMAKQVSGLDRPSEEFLQAIGDWYDGKLWVFNVLGTAKTERMLEVFEYARRRYGITNFIIDSLSKCGIAEDDYPGQKDFVERLCEFSHQHDVHIHLVAHARKGQDEQGIPGKLDVKGTGAITDMVDQTFTVWRNKRKEDQIPKIKKQIEHLDLKDKLTEGEGKSLRKDKENLEKVTAKPDVIIMQDKNRNRDWEGKVPLWFDMNSFQYLVGPDLKPKAYVNFTETPYYQNKPKAYEPDFGESPPPDFTGGLA
jgi:twinkle protein